MSLVNEVRSANQSSVESVPVVPLTDGQPKSSFPAVTYTLVALNVLVYIWDRHGSIFGPNMTFADLAMRPNEVVSAFGGGSHFPIATVFTSMFLHGNLGHIAGNMVFLVVFGEGIEAAFGPFRFVLLYLLWGIIAAAAQIYVNPASTVPTIGASGAIGGVLGSYFLLFPTNKLEIYVPILVFLSFEVSAWILLGLWFLWQLLVPQDGVANWAHAGGFLGGMLTVLFLGGRKKLLRGREHEFEFV